MCERVRVLATGVLSAALALPLFAQQGLLPQSGTVFRAGTTLVTLSNASTVIEVSPAGSVVSTWTAPVSVARAVRYRLVDGQWVGP